MHQFDDNTVILQQFFAAIFFSHPPNAQVYSDWFL
jgi:hypothetical protein